MKAVLINKLTSFVELSAIDIFHYYNYHGSRLYNDSESDMSSSPARLAGKNDTPRIIVNGFRINHILQPKTDLIVSERIKGLLAKFRRIQFKKVFVEKVVNIPYVEKEFSHWD